MNLHTISDTISQPIAKKSLQPENLDYKSLLQNAFLELRKMRIERDTLKFQQTEPIAIIGIGCRFPQGANTPEAYWQLLSSGVNTITEIPAERWDIDAYYDPDPNAPGKMYTRYGSFLDDIESFDAHFFGISAKEAADLDPQQRLLMEMSWEALENAGQPLEKIQGSKTGVFIGMTSDDYAHGSINPYQTEQINVYRSLGSLRCMSAGRLAYFYNFQGPAIQLDTACSSSLVSVHQACQSLRLRECNLAVAGGINLMISPETTIGLCKMRALTTDNRCKTFDAQADGYVRGEGGGLVVLKRLSEALADGDNILAVIRGSATNHDGLTNGLTAPNGQAQEAVIEQALRKAQVGPDAIQYVEAHGTGTALGDPIEVLALGKVLSQNRQQNNPLTLGSVKTNLGHLEGAAGIASLIKVVLSLKNKQIPPHLHLQTPNSYIPWDKLPVKVPSQLSAWQSPQGSRLAGVSSFGMSGTNVHLIVEESNG
ncbi:MAG: polyketide synthase [Crocosphaera sp.]|nr:polyketide synthase [Crocosphaera sp.]